MRAAVGVALAAALLLLASLGESAGADHPSTAGSPERGDPPSVVAGTTTEAFCPPAPSVSSLNVSVCNDNDVNATAGSTLFLFVGVNNTAPESLTVGDWTSDTENGSNNFTLVADSVDYAIHHSLWLYESVDAKPMAWGRVWVNVSVPVRLVLGTVDVANGVVADVSASHSGVSKDMKISLKGSPNDDLLFLVAFDNMTLASTVCGFHGTLAVDGKEIIKEAPVTYRNLVVGYLVNRNGTSPVMNFHFGNADAGRGCTVAETPYIGYLVAFAG